MGGRDNLNTDIFSSQCYQLLLFDDKRLVKTSKTENIESAKEVALLLYYQVDARTQNKLPATRTSCLDFFYYIVILRMDTDSC